MQLRGLAESTRSCDGSDFWIWLPREVEILAREVERIDSEKDREKRLAV